MKLDEVLKHRNVKRLRRLIVYTTRYYPNLPYDKSVKKWLIGDYEFWDGYFKHCDKQILSASRKYKSILIITIKSPKDEFSRE